MPNMEKSDDAVKSPLLIISYPRTASNLLLRMLSLPDQHDALSPNSGGYFFYPAIGHMRKAGLLDKPPQKWSEEETKTTQPVFQACYEKDSGTHRHGCRPKKVGDTVADRLDGLVLASMSEYEYLTDRRLVM